MYLSRVQLDTDKRGTIKALASPAIFHGAVESAFEGEKKRKLWRLDILNGKRYILILSENMPKLENFAEQFGYPGEYETKNYQPLLERIENGSKWSFRLTANPTYAKADGTDGKRGTVKAHRTEAHQREWLIRKAEQNGFSVNNEEFFVNGAEYLRFFKRGGSSSHKVNMLSVRYDGVLYVTDKEKFKNALCCGIGREKAYGMGLLTVMRPANG